MQIKEIAWADSNSQYPLKERPDGSIELSVDGNIVNFHERQAVETLIEAWSRFESQSREPVERKSNAVATDERPASMGADFPKKVRNAIFIMVAVGATILLVDSLLHVMLLETFVLEDRRPLGSTQMLSTETLHKDMIYWSKDLVGKGLS